MSWRRAKTPGWAAFNQKPKQALEPRINSEPFPSLPSTISSLQPCNSLVKNNNFSDKSFASAALPSVNFPARLKDERANITSEVGNSSGHFGNNDCLQKEYDSVCGQLKVLYSWADDSLIEDILAAVNNDFEKASSSLKAMVSDNSVEDFEGTGVTVCDSSLKYDTPDGKALHSDTIISPKTTDPAELTSNFVTCLGDDSGNMKSDCFCDEKLQNGSSSMNFVPGQLTGAPIEPEWEEDDIYLSHRKDAIKIIRAASRHSKAAANSFSRGDHLSARHFSQKAREEWEAAEKLHQKAASEILRIWNDKNGMWKLDLHGLHAVEAVQALKERLSMIETQVASTGSAFPGYTARKREAQHGLSCSSVDEMKSCNEPPLIRQRPVSLEVITGIGNHSRGEAAIPAAVRSFLIDNGYRYEESRPGVIMVRPKFRHR